MAKEKPKAVEAPVEKCGVCRYRRGNTCCRRAPAPMNRNDADIRVCLWPTILYDLGCGDFKPELKPQQPPATEMITE